jgi:hypothetical protein
LSLKGPTSPSEIRERAKKDADFRERLLEFIAHVASETLPDQPPASVEEEFQKGSRAFQPLLDPDLPYFEDQMKIDLYDMVSLHETCTIQSIYLHASKTVESGVERDFQGN